MCGGMWGDEMWLRNAAPRFLPRASFDACSAGHGSGPSSGPSSGHGSGLGTDHGFDHDSGHGSGEHAEQ